MSAIPSFSDDPAFREEDSEEVMSGVDSSTASSPVSGSSSRSSSRWASNIVLQKKKIIVTPDLISSNRFLSIILDNEEDLAKDTKEGFLKANIFSKSHVRLVMEHQTCLNIDPTRENTLTTFTNRLVKVIKDPSDVSYINNNEIYLFACITAQATNYKRSINRYYVAPEQIAVSLLNYAIAITTDLQPEIMKNKFLSCLKQEGRFFGIGLSKLTILLFLNGETTIVQCSIKNFEINHEERSTSGINQERCNIYDKIRFECEDYIHNASRIHVENLHISVCCFTDEDENSFEGYIEDNYTMSGLFRDHETSLIESIKFMYNNYYPGEMKNVTMSVDTIRANKKIMNSKIISVLTELHEPNHNIGMAGAEVLSTFVNGYPPYSVHELSTYWINVLTPRERKVITEAIDRISHSDCNEKSCGKKRRIHDI